MLVCYRLPSRCASRGYHGLGIVAQEQGAFQQAWDYFLHALEIFLATEDDYWSGIVLHYLARLWLVAEM
jgi:hypothetical protein